MKIFLASLLSITTLMAFSQCEDGRYRNFVFADHSLTTAVSYGTNIDVNGVNQELMLDIYEPSGDVAIDRPLVIMAHGGSFIGGTRDGVDVVPMCEDLAKMGYVVASITYRLGIPFSLDLEKNLTEAVQRGVHDMRAAIRFMRSTAQNDNPYRIDEDEIYLGGVSAGGFITLHTAYLDEESEIPSIIDQTAAGLGGGLEGESGNPGISSEVKGIVNIAGALKDTTWMHTGDEPVCSFHGTGDTVVPFGSDILEFSTIPVTDVDGSESVHIKADEEGITNCFEVYWLQGHVPHITNQAYYDTTLSITVNFLSHLHCGVDLDCEYREIENLVSVDEEDQISWELDVYPNPSGDQLRISGMKGLKPDDLSISNLEGRLFAFKTISQNDELIVLDISDLASGVYLVALRNGSQVATRKVVKE